MEKYLFFFAAFGCLGMTTEIFFTALSDAVTALRSRSRLDYGLQGHSYIWMFPIYGLAGILFPLAYAWIADFPLLVRLLIYVLGIFAVEFITGWLLELCTGKCPWKYDTKWAVKGFIRLDYAPFWFVFGWIIESVYLFLANNCMT